jgi:hypothetical protein
MSDHHPSRSELAGKSMAYSIIECARLLYSGSTIRSFFDGLMKPLIFEYKKIKGLKHG